MRKMRPFRRPRRLVVQDVRVIDGRRIATVLDPKTLDVIASAVVKGWGGSPTSYVLWPVSTPDDPTGKRFAIEPELSNAAEAWVEFDRDGAAYVDGVTPREQYDDLQARAPELVDGDIHPGTFGPQDLVMANGTDGDTPSKVILGADRSFNVLANGSVRIQVPDGFTVRVTKDGDGGMAVVKFEPCQDAFNRVIERLNTVSAGLSALQTVTGLIVPGTGGANPVTGTSFEHVPEADVGEEIASQTLFVPYDTEEELPPEDER